jgi:hypothetical protein
LWILEEAQCLNRVVHSSGHGVPLGAQTNEKKFKYFWARDAKSSNAEVDYLVTSGTKVYPVEVKSGKTGTLKSMRLFLKEHPACPLGIRFSMQKLSFYDRILSIPLYMVKHWERIVKSIG